jgi:hypothetical protein
VAGRGVPSAGPQPFAEVALLGGEMNLTSDDCCERPLLLANTPRSYDLEAGKATKRSRLRKAEVLSIGGAPTTNQACLLGDRFDVVECDASVVAF